MTGSFADYLASLLDQFSRTAHLGASPAGGGDASANARGAWCIISDLLLALREASPAQSVLCCGRDVGNYSLFLTGMFPRECGAPQHTPRRAELLLL